MEGENGLSTKALASIVFLRVERRRNKKETSNSMKSSAVERLHRRFADALGRNERSELAELGKIERVRPES